MSTVTAVKKNGYISIAADTLVSVGPMKMTTTYNKTCRKILRVGDSYLGMTGWMVGVQVLDSLFRLAGAPPRLSAPSEIFEVFPVVHVRLRDEYFMNPRTDAGDAYEMTQVNVLLANPHGIFTVGGCRTVSEYERFWAAGSGMEYALGAMHALYESHLIRQTPAAAEEFDLPLHV